MNPTYEMCRAGSEHGDKPQRQSLTNQLPFLHVETQSHHATKSISLLVFHFGSKLIHKKSCARSLVEALAGNISHHLKVLAAAGVIEEAPELAKNRRERWWRSARAFSTESWVTLTPERLDEFGSRIGELIQEYVEAPSEGPGAEPVYVFAHAMPARP